MANLIGTVDGYSAGKVYGWAREEGVEDSPVSIAVFGGETLLETVLATMYRPDLEKAGIGHGRYGFCYAIPPSLSPSRAVLRFMFVKTGQDLSNSPFDLTAKYFPHRDTLRTMFGNTFTSLEGLRFDGETLEITGSSLPIAGDPERNLFVLDGHPIENVEYPIKNVAWGGWFWFYPRSTDSGFVARVDLSTLNRRRTYYEFDVVDRDLGYAASPFHTLYLPKSMAVFENVPDQERQRRVLGWSNDAKYVVEGFTHYKRYLTLTAQIAQRDWSSIRAFLDWGCGCGRLTRNVPHEANKGSACRDSSSASSRTIPRSASTADCARVVGVDIDADNVAWCAANLSEGEFLAVDLYPPMPFPDATFDLIIGNSVMTHLSEKEQFLWLAELCRVSRPGATVLLSVHGEIAVAFSSKPMDWIDVWRAKGIDASSRNLDLSNYITDDDYYRNVYHTEEYIRKYWAKYFDIRRIVKRAISHQDVVVLTKRI